MYGRAVGATVTYFMRVGRGCGTEPRPCSVTVHRLRDHPDMRARASPVALHAMPKVRIRPLTILLVLGALVLIAIGVVYVTKTAADLPAFFPGHTARDATHHYKHGAAAFTLALVAIGAAWFTTAPDRPPET